MTETSNSPSPEGARHSPPGFIRQLFALVGPYWNSEEKWKVRGFAALLVLLTVGQVVIPIRINMWSANLFDALEQRSMDQFLVQIGVVLLILLANVVVTATHLRLKRRIQLDWRRWLTQRLLNRWMAAGRHFQVTFMPGEHDNPDGRIAEDIRNATEAALDLAHSLFYCLLLLFSFTNILWTLSGTISLTVTGMEMSVPGHMVWVAVLYAAAGTTAALLLGRPLVRTVNKRQTVEANFRFGLVRARENSEAIALINGEADERRRFGDLFKNIEIGWNAQTRALTRIFMFSSGYSVLSTAFPVVIAAPRYIAGSISLGTLMQTAQAFQQMTQALSWPIDNLSKAAEWKASVERVLGLWNALKHLEEDVAEVDEHSITVVTSDEPVLAFRDLHVANPDGEVTLEALEAEIGLGERVLICGDPAAAVRLFKVVAGLWPWGGGRVELPGGADIFFMPQRPYLPIGRLRSVVCYPDGPDAYPDEQLEEVLAQVGLEHLKGRLEDRETWDKVLTAGEQQRLGFARLLLHRPNWIFLQEATDGLDANGERALMSLLLEELPQATVITVGYHRALENYHHRKLALERSNSGKVMVKQTWLRREAERAKRRPGLDWRDLLLARRKRRKSERRP